MAASARRPVALPVEENPGVLDLVGLGLGIGLALVLYKAAAAGADPVGSGDAGGIDPATGRPAVPGATSFRLVSLAADAVVNAFYRGQAIQIPAVVSHRGPAGAYVVGLDLAYADLVGSFLGVSHGAPIQTLEANLAVGDDAVFRDYAVTLAGTFAGGCCGALDARLFVRDLGGRLLVEDWAQQSMFAV